MKKRFVTVAALMFAMGCNLGGGTTVCRPSAVITPSVFNNG